MGRNERIILELLTELVGRFLAQQLLSGQPVTDEQLAAAKAKRKAELAATRAAIDKARQAEPE